MSEKEKILIIDDEPDICETLKKYLSREYQVLTALKGSEGIDLIKENNPAVVLLDYRLPDIDGLEVLKQIQAHNPDIYVILMTAYGSEQLIVDALRGGIVDYFSKPFDIEKLLLAVKKFTSPEQKSFRASLKNKILELGKINQELANRNLLLKELNFMASEILNVSELDKLVDLIVKKSKEVAGADESLVMLYDEERKNLAAVPVPESKKFLEKLSANLRLPLADFKIPVASSGNTLLKVIAEKRPGRVKNLEFMVALENLPDLKKKEILPIEEAHLFPIISRERGALGVLVNIFYQKVPDTFGELNLKLLMNFTDQAGAAIERDQLIQKNIDAIYDKLDSLYEASSAFIFTSDPLQMVDTIMARLKSAIKYDVFGIIFTFADNDWLAIQIVSQVSDEFIDLVREKLIKSYQALTARKIDSEKISVVIKKSGEIETVKRGQLTKTGSSLTAPLIVSEKIFGLVNVSFQEENAFNASDKKFFNAIVNQASMTLESVLYEKEKTLSAKLKKESLRTSHELKMAQYVQKWLLPRNLPEISGFEIAGANLPSLELGGDFYHFIPISENRFGIVIGDVAGKGIPAALLMAMSNTLFFEYGKSNLSPAQVLAGVDKALKGQVGLKSPLYVTAFYGILDTSKRDFFFAKAGHNPPIYYSQKDNKIFYLEGDGSFLGIFDVNNFTESDKKIDDGDAIVLYTDGVTEAKNKKNEFFGRGRLERIIQDNFFLPAADLILKIQKEISCFMDGQPARDDITLVVIKKINEKTEKFGSFEVPADLKNIYPAFDRIKSAVSIPEKLASKIRMAFSEAVHNAIQHGSANDKTKNIKIYYFKNDYLVKFSISDPGVGFNTVLDLSEIDPLRRRGRGLTLIRTVMDEVNYNERGNQINMIKYLTEGKR